MYCGPELADPVWAAPLDPPLPWNPGDPRPLVLVGLSSSYQAQESLLARLIAALALLPVRALVTLGPGLPQLAGDVPANVEIRASASHAAVLPHTALTITHGGHGTVMRSLAAGVPLLVFPMGRDQSDNAARLEWLGAGRRLPASSSTSRIVLAIKSALASGALREAARAFATRLHTKRTDVVIEELELLAQGPAAH